MYSTGKLDSFWLVEKVEVFNGATGETATFACSEWTVGCAKHGTNTRQRLPCLDQSNKIRRRCCFEIALVNQCMPLRPAIGVPVAAVRPDAAAAQAQRLVRLTASARSQTACAVAPSWMGPNAGW